MKKGEKGDITKFSKDFWRTAVGYGGSDESVLRNYDIMKDHKNGLSYSQLSIKYGLSRRGIINICKDIK